MTPRIRQTLYGVGTIATALLTLLSVWKIIDPSTASTVSAAVAGLLSLVGAGAAGTAAVVVTRQQKNGAFDEVSPSDQVIGGINAVIDAQRNAQAEVERVKDALSTAVKDVPVLGPLAQQAIDRLP